MRRITKVSMKWLGGAPVWPAWFSLGQYLHLVGVHLLVELHRLFGGFMLVDNVGIMY